MSRRLRVLGERKEVPNKAATIFQAENDFIVGVSFWNFRIEHMSSVSLLNSCL
jgi:hypothetical protein